jgi:hypothetical protein
MEERTEESPPRALTRDMNNATCIPAEEALPHKREKYKRLRSYNRGLWNGPKRENKQAVRRRDNLHTYDAVASKLGLTRHQKRRGRHLIDDLHVKSFGKSIDAIAFAVAAVVANQDVPDGSRYWPHPEHEDNDEPFVQMADDLDLDTNEQLSVIMQVKSRTDL